MIPHGVGIAAGIDKNGTLFETLLALGANFVEVGTVTRLPNHGNPPPRIRREGDTLVNHMGLPNDGIVAVSRRVRQISRNLVNEAGVIGLSVAPDCLDNGLGNACVGFDYVVVNLSCPNVAGDSVVPKRPADLHKPLFAKIGVEDDPRLAATVLRKQGYDGVVAVNSLPVKDGGLSGPPLFARAVETVARLADVLAGDLPIIGVGGIASGEDARAMIHAGASAVQIHTGFLLRGASLIDEIKEGMKR